MSRECAARLALSRSAHGDVNAHAPLPLLGDETAHWGPCARCLRMRHHGHGPNVGTDQPSRGRQRLMTLHRWPHIGLFACLALAGCARPDQASAEQEKEVPVAEAQPSSGEIAAREVAEQLDRIADEAPHPSSHTVPVDAPVTPPPPGPLLASSDLIDRTTRLIASLKSSQDLAPERVAAVTGLALGKSAEHPDGRGWTVRGRLSDGGEYSLDVDALYLDTPNDWTVSITGFGEAGSGSHTSAKSQCSFSQETLKRHVTALGYSANEGWSDRAGRERSTYVKRIPGLSFSVTALVHRVGASDNNPGEACVGNLRIEADTKGR
ncbi:hypothetical protein SAMN05421681_104356 [Lysobacter enzymogenes]|nr:hypothetical protein SAMN05421681_104356 [Lysobacter enzymogenes]